MQRTGAPWGTRCPSPAGRCLLLSAAGAAPGAAAALAISNVRARGPPPRGPWRLPEFQRASTLGAESSQGGVRLPESTSSSSVLTARPSVDGRALRAVAAEGEDAPRSTSAPAASPATSWLALAPAPATPTPPVARAPAAAASHAASLQPPPIIRKGRRKIRLATAAASARTPRRADPLPRRQRQPQLARLVAQPRQPLQLPTSLVPTPPPVEPAAAQARAAPPRQPVTETLLGLPLAPALPADSRLSAKGCAAGSPMPTQSSRCTHGCHCLWPTPRMTGVQRQTS